jgi:hypothetical protein
MGARDPTDLHVADRAAVRERHRLEVRKRDAPRPSDARDGLAREQRLQIKQTGPFTDKARPLPIRHGTDQARPLPIRHSRYRSGTAVTDQARPLHIRHGRCR